MVTAFQLFALFRRCPTDSDGSNTDSSGRFSKVVRIVYTKDQERWRGKFLGKSRLEADDL